MTNKEKALDYFSRDFCCAQSVLSAFADKCGLTEEQALKLGACFGSGMRKAEVCGACTGALMVLGALYGHCDENDQEHKQHSKKISAEMMDKFAEKMGSCICRDILGCDISTEEGVKTARANNLFTELCPKAVANAVDILEEIISENNNIPGDERF